MLIVKKFVTFKPENDRNFCLNCRNSLNKCECGARVEDEENFCKKCGQVFSLHLANDAKISDISKFSARSDKGEKSLL